MTPRAARASIPPGPGRPGDLAASRPRLWLEAARPRTLPAAIAPVLAASALAWHDGAFAPAPAALCLAFALLVQVATNFANDYFDFVKGADTAARVGPRRAVAAGLIAPGTMKRAIAATFAAAFITGLGLLPWGGWWLLGVGVASLASGYAYTGGPWPLAYHGLGDLFVFLFFGLVAVAATYALQAGSVTAEAWLVAVGIGALAANILVVNNYRDAETDAVAGKRTLVVRWGRDAAKVQFVASLVVAGLVPAALWQRGFGPWVLLPLVLTPVAVRHVRALRPAAGAAALITLLGATGKLLALYAALLAIGLVLAR